MFTSRGALCSLLLDRVQSDKTNLPVANCLQQEVFLGVPETLKQREL